MIRRYPNMYARLTSNVTVPEDQPEATACWEHQGTLNKRGGYPRVSVRTNGKHSMAYAHHLMFKLMNGPIPAGHEVDHVCHNHRCINPDHLQPLPMPENRALNRPWRGRS